MFFVLSGTFEESPMYSRLFRSLVLAAGVTTLAVAPSTPAAHRFFPIGEIGSEGLYDWRIE